MKYNTTSAFPTHIDECPVLQDASISQFEKWKEFLSKKSTSYPDAVKYIGESDVTIMNADLLNMFQNRIRAVMTYLKSAAASVITAKHHEIGDTAPTDPNKTIWISYASIEDEIVTDCYRIKAGDKWQKVAFWTKASMVECADGTNLESKISGVIKAQIDALRTELIGG